MNTHELCSFLQEAGIHEDVVKSFSENRINGLGFFSLTEDEFNELIPMIGDRVTVRRLKQKLETAAVQQSDQTMVSVYVCNSLLTTYLHSTAV